MKDGTTMDEMVRAQAAADATNDAPAATEHAFVRRSARVYVELLSASQRTDDWDAQDAMTSAVDLISTYWSHLEASDLRVAMEAIHDGLLDLLNEIVRTRRATTAT
jgi:hypothetical protein